MKQSELRQLIREEIRKVMNEAGKVDTAFVLKDIKRFNTGDIDVETLAIDTVKNLGYTPTPTNVKNAMEHLALSVDPETEKLPMDTAIVDELRSIMK